MIPQEYPCIKQFSIIKRDQKIGDKQNNLLQIIKSKNKIRKVTENHNCEELQSNDFLLLRLNEFIASGSNWATK